MFTHMTVGKVTLLAALVGVCGIGFATMTSAEEVHQTVLREVMRECRITEVSEASIFVMVPGLMGRTPTNQEIELYVASKTNFQQASSGNSKCWTFARWQKYARSILKDQQKQSIKAGNLKP